MHLNSFLLGALLLSAVVGFSGCTTTYVPEGSAADPKLVPHIPAGSIALINAQPSTETVLIGEAGAGRSVRGDLHRWTDQVIDVLKETHKKKGVVANERSTKSIKVAVTKAQLLEAGSGWAFRCKVDFTLETSDGRRISLVAEDTSWKFLNACDGAITKIPLVVFSDERVLKFLREP